MTQINLKKNILFSGSTRAVVVLLTFLTSIFTARYLGVELKGKLSFLTAISGFVWMFLDFGLYRTYPYIIRKNPEKTNTLFDWTAAQFVIFSVILISIGLLFKDFWTTLIGFQFNSLYIVLFAFMITIPMLNMQLQNMYLGQNRIVNHSLAQLINTILLLLFVLNGYLLLKQTEKLLYIIIVTLIASLSSIIYYILNYESKSLWEKLRFKHVLVSYKSGFRVFLSTIFIMLLIRFDIVLIKRMLDFKQVGIYSLAAQIIEMLQVASNLVGGLLLVKLADSSNDIEKWKLMKKLLMAFFVMLVAANVFFIILGKFLISTLFGMQFIPVYYVYLWLIPASFGLSFGSLFNMYLNSKNFPVVSIVLPAVALILNIIMNLILIPVFQIKGAAIATSVAYLLWFLMILFYEQKYSKYEMLAYLKPQKLDWSHLYIEAKSMLRSILKSKIKK